MKKIYYDRKSTSANTEYLHIDKNDQDWLLLAINSVNNYMQELSITKDKDIKDFVNWYRKPNKNLPYNNKMKKYNSPESLMSGMLNNIMFGTQQNFSITQLNHIEYVLNNTINIIEFLEQEYNLKLQEHKYYEKIMAIENLWVVDDK